MNKKVIFAVITVPVIGVLLFFIYGYREERGSGSLLSAEEIKEVVTNQYPGTIERVTASDKEPGIYEVIVMKDSEEYRLKVEGTSGRVIDLVKNPLSEEHKREDTSETESDEPSAVHKESGEGNDEHSAEKPERSVFIGTEKAKEIALEQFSGTVVEIELDEDDGIMVYEIEIANERGEATVEIDAYTGKVIIVDLDMDDD